MRFTLPCIHTMPHSSARCACACVCVRVPSCTRGPKPVNISHASQTKCASACAGIHIMYQARAALVVRIYVSHRVCVCECIRNQCAPARSRTSSRVPPWKTRPIIFHSTCARVRGFKCNSHREKGAHEFRWIARVLALWHGVSDFQQNAYDDANGFLASVCNVCLYQ